MAYHIDNRNLNRMQINVNERYEAKVWCHLFNCSRKELKTAVEKVGSSAGAVKKFISTGLA